MKPLLIISLLIIQLQAFGQKNPDHVKDLYPPVEKVAADFKALLKRPLTALRPYFQTITSDSIVIEKGFIYSEETEKVPILIYKPVAGTIKSFPVVICLHGTGGNKEDENIRQLLYQLARKGIMGVAIDARYHGERITGKADGSKQYVEAIKAAWKSGDVKGKHPFFLDTVYDLWRVTDYLITRPDVQANRIGMMGISMGGIETWMAASVDQRIKVAVPVIAAQSFNWSLENNKWQGRARTIWNVHQQAALDLGDTAVTTESVRLVWSKLLPGITNEFDCPSMIRLFAPRPLLLLNNEEDQNCPLEGAKIVFKVAEDSYKNKKATDRLKIYVSPHQPHRFLPEHAKMTIEWFEKWL